MPGLHTGIKRKPAKHSALKHGKPKQSHITLAPRPANAPQGRLFSLDFFRGLTIFLLIAEFTGLFNLLTDPVLGGAGELSSGMIGSLIVLFGLWYLCYWLYKRKTFIKI